MSRKRAILTAVLVVLGLVGILALFLWQSATRLGRDIVSTADRAVDACFLAGGDTDALLAMTVAEFQTVDPAVRAWFYATIDAALGAFQAREVVGWRASTQTDTRQGGGTHAEVDYLLHFERGTVRTTVTMRKEGGVWKIVQIILDPRAVPGLAAGPPATP